MNSSVINSSRPFTHSSSGLSLYEIYCADYPFEDIFIFTERSINLVVGYPANIMVMWLVAREKSDSSTSNNFIFSLALADAWFCIISPICCYGLIILLNDYFFYLLDFTTGIINGSVLFLACICLDRYVAVVHPIVFTSIKDKKIRGALSMLVWGLVIAYAICRSEAADYIGFHHEIYIGLIIASFITMVYCSVCIMWSLRKSVLGKDKMHPMKKKALRTVQIYLGIIVFHYMPTVVITVFSYKPTNPVICTISYIIFSFKELSCITQPLLYMSQIKQLPWLKNLLCICCRSPSPEPHNVST